MTDVINIKPLSKNKVDEADLNYGNVRVLLDRNLGDGQTFKDACKALLRTLVEITVFHTEEEGTSQESKLIQEIDQARNRIQGVYAIAREDRGEPQPNYGWD